MTGGAATRKQTEQAMGNKAVSNVPPQSLLQFLPWLPLMIDCNLSVK